MSSPILMSTPFSLLKMFRFEHLHIESLDQITFQTESFDRQLRPVQLRHRRELAAVCV